MEEDKEQPQSPLKRLKLRATATVIKQVEAKTEKEEQPCQTSATT